MAIAKVQAVTSATSATSIASTGAGNFLVVVLFGTGTSSPTFTAPTATGVTFTKMTSLGSGAGTMDFGSAGTQHCWAQVYTAVNIPAAVTSVSWGVSTNPAFMLYEFSGLGTAPTQNGESDNTGAGQTSGNLNLTVSATGANTNLGFTFILSRTSGGVAGNTVTAIADANSNTWQGSGGVDTNTTAGTVRIGASWATLTAAIGNVTFTEAGVAFKGGCAFAFAVTASTSHLLGTCGCGT
jgi:hypothetical protein